MMKKIHPIVMLPTDKFTNGQIITTKMGMFYETVEGVIKQTDNIPVPIDDKHRALFKRQHLYVLSNEEIKQGDWVYESNLNTNHNGIYQIVKGREEIGFFRFRNVFVTINTSSAKKIIATTDDSLYNEELPFEPGEKVKYKYLPKLSEDFVKEYCERDGVDEIEVYYTSNLWEGFSGHYYRDSENIVLQVNSNNTINASFIEEKMYTREEVVKIIRRFDMSKYGKDIPTKDFDNWIKTNLK